MYPEEMQLLGPQLQRRDQRLKHCYTVRDWLLSVEPQGSIWTGHNSTDLTQQLEKESIMKINMKNDIPPHKRTTMHMLLTCCFVHVPVDIEHIKQILKHCDLAVSPEPLRSFHL